MCVISEDVHKGRPTMNEDLVQYVLLESRQYQSSMTAAVKRFNIQAGSENKHEPRVVCWIYLMEDICNYDTFEQCKADIYGGWQCTIINTKTGHCIVPFEHHGGATILVHRASTEEEIKMYQLWMSQTHMQNGDPPPYHLLNKMKQRVNRNSIFKFHKRLSKTDNQKDETLFM